MTAGGMLSAVAASHPGRLARVVTIVATIILLAGGALGPARAESAPARAAATPTAVLGSDAAAKYVDPLGFGSDQVDKPYESLVQIGTIAASGKSGQKSVFQAIWDKFRSRSITHPILDTATGQVSYGPAFKYYDDSYTTIADYFNDDPGSCPLFTGMLATDSGHCGNFGAFLTGMLAFQGIQANAIKLGNVPAFEAGPDPARGYSPFRFSYMLVGPGLWKFGTKNASGPFPHRDKVTVGAHGDVTISGPGVSYKSSKPIAQGPVSDPPMMFPDGDHVIANVLLKGMTTAQLVDPSYGKPQSLRPYTDFPAYEKSAIAGFAVVYKTTTAKGKTTTVPLSNLATIGKDCASSAGKHVVCYFQATPLK